MRKCKFAAKRSRNMGNRWTRQGEGDIIQINIIWMKEFLL